MIPSRARLTLPPSLNLKCIKEDGKISKLSFEQNNTILLTRVTLIRSVYVASFMNDEATE